MKKTIIGMLAMATLSLTSCNEASKLASEVNGSWSSTPQMLVNDQGSQATIVETVTFERDSDKAGGHVVFTGMISCTGSMQGNEAMVQPFELAASARSSVSGEWTAVDDDEIVLKLDVEKMTVDVDPSALVLSTNILTGSNESNPESLKPQMAAVVQGALRRQLVARYTSMSKLDDVELKDKGSMLKFEVGKKDFVYTSQNPTVE